MNSCQFPNVHGAAGAYRCPQQLGIESDGCRCYAGNGLKAVDRKEANSQHSLLWSVFAYGDGLCTMT